MLIYALKHNTECPNSKLLLNAPYLYACYYSTKKLFRKLLKNVSLRHKIHFRFLRSYQRADIQLLSISCNEVKKKRYRLWHDGRESVLSQMSYLLPLFTTIVIEPLYPFFYIHYGHMQRCRNDFTNLSNLIGSEENVLSSYSYTTKFT